MIQSDDNNAPRHLQDRLERFLLGACAALVIVLVATFGVFLLQVFYGGAYALRCGWIVGCLVMGVAISCRCWRGSDVLGSRRWCLASGQSVRQSMHHRRGWWSTAKLTRDTSRFDHADAPREKALQSLGLHDQVKSPHANQPPTHDSRGANRESNENAVSPRELLGLPS